MDAVLIKLIESSVSAALLAAVLWLFLPRLVRSIDALTELNTRQHEALTLLLVHLERRLTWHEARALGDAPVDDPQRERLWRTARESFDRANAELMDLRRDLMRVFGVPRGDS